MFDGSSSNRQQVELLGKNFWKRPKPTLEYQDYHEDDDAIFECRAIVENVEKISEIIEIDRHVSSRSGAKDRPENSFKPFAQSWIQKEARCLGTSPINTKKHDGSNFHLRSLGQTE
ncbi:hypothetical protein TNCV_1736271 [Trichonephila clavipes]|nr:hypothetical protein TNCV_1736271 [Trichonephila clavipes]